METLSNCGGGKRIRTADPLHAMQVLYQLSYTPERDCALYRYKKKNARQFEKIIFAKLFQLPYRKFRKAPAFMPRI